MTDTCPKCGRPRWPTGALSTPSTVHCWHEGGRECEGYAAGYHAGRQDGIDEGVRIAERLAFATKYGDVSFHAVEREVAQAKKQSRIRPLAKEKE